MSAQSQWHPIALAQSIAPGTAAGARVEDRELVVWRDEGGQAHVWADRCPHRGMRFSLGFVRGDRIGCLYHGWQFSGDGQCRHIPAHPDAKVSRAIKAEAYRSEERCGMVWVATDPAIPPLALPEGLGETLGVTSLYLDCDAKTAVAHLKDSRLAPFGGGAVGVTIFESLAETLFRLSCGGQSLLVGLHVAAAGRTALHIVIEGDPEVCKGPGQAHYLRWAIRLRSHVETASLLSDAVREVV